MRGGKSRMRRWAVIGLICYGIAVAIVLFSPVSYGGIVSRIGDWFATELGLDWFGSGWIEFGANILMFAPLGFLLVMLIGRFRWGILVAMALSAGAEVIQIVIPHREPTLRDVLSNTLGAIIGAALAKLIFRRQLRRGERGSEQSLDHALPESDGAVEPGPAVEDRGD